MMATRTSNSTRLKPRESPLESGRVVFAEIIFKFLKLRVKVNVSHYTYLSL
jgi:hypothetical protein